MPGCHAGLDLNLQRLRVKGELYRCYIGIMEKNMETVFRFRV